MEIDGDSKLGRIFEQFALSLNQHSKLTAISVDFINMERHKSMHEHTLGHFEAHTHTHIRKIPHRQSKLSKYSRQRF